MAQLLSANNLSHSFAGRTLFEGVSLGVFSGDRIGLVGPNGAGKSTLLKILSNQIKPDSGEVVTRRGLQVGVLAQDPQFGPDETLFDAIISKAHDPIEASGDAWTWISKLELDRFPFDIKVSQLSGGWRKRLALGRELILNPELLLLDEPTNHLDVDAILWLEDFLASTQMATITITHDRLFLQRVANKIFDLDPKNPQALLIVDGDYTKYLETKELLLAGQKHREWTMKNTLRRETEWLRRGAKARLTKQKARIDRAHDLKDEVFELSLKNRNRKVEIEFAERERNPKKLIEVNGISKSFGDRQLVKDFSFLVGPKTRMGLLGPNGIGKSTLIRMMLGLEKPDAGSVKVGDGIKISYFEQYRDTLDPKKSVLKNICPEGDYVSFRGGYMHVRTYLEKFLFGPHHMDLPVSRLSGGEQSRLRISQLMLEDSAVLVLDEPTNDLDFETLSVLEDALRDFPGAVVLVTHDRYFMDQVCSEILAFSMSGKIERFADYLQWEAWRDAYGSLGEKAPQTQETKPNTASPDAKSKTKLSYKEKLELEGMEANIAKLEDQLKNLEFEIVKPENIANSKKLQELSGQIGELQSKIETMYERWQVLENK